MIRIAYLVSNFRRTGPTNQLFNIVSNLDLNIFEPTIITLSPEIEGESLMPKFKKLHQVKFYHLEMSRLKGLFLNSSKVKGIINIINPDIIHSNGIRADFISSRLIHKSKRVSTLRNFPYEDYTMLYGKLQGIIMAYSHLKFLGKLDYIACVSNFIHEKVNLYFKNSLVIHNGSNTQIFNTNYDLDSSKRKLGLKLNEIIIISVGHLSNRKNPLVIIKAFKNIKAQNVRLLFLGSGPLYDDCIKATGNDNRIVLLGRVDNVNEYLAASNIFISSSLSEGLPNSVLEAHAMNKVSILSDIPQHKELIENPEFNFLFPPKDSDVLAKILTNVLEKEISKTKVQYNFTHSATGMSIKYQELYKNILK